VTGAGADVRIRRDRWHVPHIEAATSDDAWFGLGYAVGQDRAFQITSYQRVVRGTLSALAGKDGLPIDRFSRRVGFAHRAGKVLQAQDAQTRAALEAYARGATAGMTAGVPVRPHELALLRGQVQEVTATDVVGVMLLFAFSLAANWDSELARLSVLVHDGEEALRKVSPSPDPRLPVTSPPGTLMGKVIDRLAGDMALLSEALPLEGASNNWALAGSRTASGKVLVANDPHLTASTPAYWYLAHVSTPDWSVAGASLVGAPSIVAGHNGHAAWSVTAGRTDSTDLFLEQIDGTRLRDEDHPDGWAQGVVRREVIEVRAALPGRPPTSVIEEVLEGPRGPIIGPAIDGAPDAIAMSATWWDEQPVRGFLDLATARDFSDIQSAFATWPMHLNVVYGNDEGQIGWHLVGTLPIRRSGNGSVPLPGWKAGVGWRDTRLQGGDLPFEVDPAGGILATANNPPTVDSPGGHNLGVDFADAYRLQSIHAALDARHDWTVADVQSLQRQTVTGPWAQLAPHLLGADASGHPSAARAQRLLHDWDGDVRADSVAASIYELTLANLTVATVASVAPNSAHAMLGRSYTPLAEHAFMALQRTAQLVSLLTERPAGWLDWNRAILDALGAAVDRLVKEHGEKEARWAWGRIRPASLRHVVSGSVSALAPIFDIPIPTGGDTHSISPQTVVPIDPLGNPLAIANLRMVVDLGDVEASRFALAGGQSGNPCSPHYDDLVAPWLGAGIPIPFSADAVNAAAVHTLRLVPGNA
ncbi:MAG: penicillin amidase, partial [Glaciecola sp.]